MCCRLPESVTDCVVDYLSIPLRDGVGSDDVICPPDVTTTHPTPSSSLSVSSPRVGEVSQHEADVDWRVVLGVVVAILLLANIVVTTVCLILRGRNCCQLQRVMQYWRRTSEEDASK